MRRLGLITFCILLLAAALAARPVAADLKYIAFGDSVTDGFGDPEGRGYPPRLRRILNKDGDETVSMFKSGVAGENSSEALSRLPSVLAGGGDVLLLMEGTNDVVALSSGAISVETVIDNLDNLALTAQRRGFEVIHATVFPRAPKALRDRSNMLTQILVRAIRGLANARKRKLVDIYEAFDPEIVEDAFETYYFTGSDPVGHPNAEGYDRIARTFADVVLEVDTTPPVVGSFLPGPLPAEVSADTEFRVPLFETVGASGIEQKESTLLINGRAVGTQEGNRRKLELVFQDADSVGCRVVLAVRSQDRANPPNTMERLLALYDVIGRSTLRGDVDFDCRVDGFDLVSLALGFGAEIGEERYQRRFDLNVDGVVDGSDLAVLAKNFGRSTL